MNNRMSEWEVQRMANNLDRIDSYRQSGKTSMYVGESNLAGRVSEWDAQRVANNLDRIDSYRDGNGIFAESQYLLGLLTGVPIFIAFIIYAIASML